MSAALILGGGGPVGIAWEIGVLAGLAEGGLDVSGFTRVIGTSAGSVVGAALAAGLTPEAIYDGHLGLERMDAGPKIDPAAMQPLITYMMRRPPGYPDASGMVEMGRHALQAKTVDEADFLAGFKRLLPLEDVWPPSFQCTAVDAETGAFKVWTQADGAGLHTAVASSCAVPGLYPPVTVNGQRYVDGGVRSPTNADLGRGCDRILMLAVTLPMAAPQMAAMAQRELQEIEADGARTSLIVPDNASHTAFGHDLMDFSRREIVLAAARAQGRAEAERLHTFWS